MNNRVINLLRRIIEKHEQAQDECDRDIGEDEIVTEAKRILEMLYHGV